jgi:hypothetical protein
MQKQNRVHSDEAQGLEMGRELTEAELATVCGGAGGGNTSNMGNLGGLGSLGSDLGSQLSSQIGSQVASLLGNSVGSPGNAAGPSNQTSGAPASGSFPAIGSLQNILGSLGGGGGL